MLFSGDIEVLYKDTGLFCGYKALFCGDIGLLCGDIVLFCGGIGLLAERIHA